MPLDPIRTASRHLVRELKMLDGCGPVPGFGISECHLLTELGQHGRLTGSELAELLLLEKSTVSRVVKKLRRRGLIEARVDGGDRRQRPLELTAAGREAVAAIHAGADRQVAGALEYLDDDDRRQVATALERYARALRFARLAEAYTLRPIAPGDDPAVARIITSVMTEFGAVGCGYSIEDAEVGAMYDAYQGERSAYFVLTDAGGEVLGGGGVAPLEGGDAGTCELRKMYFMPQLRGTGSGARLLKHCLDTARAFGFARCYLETLEWMHQARHLYRKAGFEDLDAPLGDTGHTKCNRWMVMELSRA